MASMEVANTIFQQLGGARFGFMVGATNLTGTENSLALRFRGSKKYNLLRIKLTFWDDYTVEFLKVHAGNVVRNEEHEHIYADELAPLFEKATGLLTRL